MEDHILSYKKYLKDAVKVGDVVYDNIFDTESEVVRGLRKSLKKKYQKPEDIFYHVEGMLISEIHGTRKRLSDLKKPKKVPLTKRIMRKVHLARPERINTDAEMKNQGKELTKLTYLSTVMLQTVYMKDKHMFENGKLDTNGKGLLFLKHYPEIMEEFSNSIESGVKLDPKVIGKIEKIRDIEAYEWLENAWKMEQGIIASAKKTPRACGI